MQATHKQLLERYERVLDFLAAYAPPEPPAAFTRWRDELVRAVERLNDLLGDQVTGRKDSRDDSRRQKVLRRALLQRHIAPVAQLAKAHLADDPVVVRALEMPDPAVATMKLVTEATAFRNKAAEYEQKLVDAGRPADFLTQLDAAIEALRQTVLDRARNVGKHVGARVGVQDAVRDARKVLLTIDAIVRDLFATNADTLARWKNAKRVKAVMGAGPRATGGTSDENLATEPEAA